MCPWIKSIPGSSDDFEQLQENLQASSSLQARRLTAFLLLLLYLLIAVVGTTDVQLFLPDSEVTMPILNIPLPLFGFYILAPLLIVILHFTILLGLFHHTTKLRAWERAASENQIKLLPGFILNYALLFKRNTIYYWLLRFIQMIILCLAPLLLLLYIQFRFSDYHSVEMTFWHLILVALDIFILFLYWYRISYPQLLDSQYNFLKTLWRNFKLVGRAWLFFLPLCSLIMLISIANLGIVILIKNDVFEERHWFIPYLDVSNQVLVQSKPSDTIIHAYIMKDRSVDSAWLEYAEGIEIPPGRDLRLADMSNSIMINASMIKACMNGAVLDSADMSGMILSGAELNRACLAGAKLNRAVLKGAELNGALSYEADMKGANLNGAMLNGADLGSTELHGADLRFAELNGAMLVETMLNGAELRNAKLNGANLMWAKLNGADLFWAELNGAYLLDTKLNGIDFNLAELNGAYLVDATMSGAFLDGANLFYCQHLDSAQIDSVYFTDSTDIISITDWYSLKKMSTKIPNAVIRARYLGRIDTAEAYCNSIQDSDSIFDFQYAYLTRIQSDSSKFVEFRKRLSCENTWVAEGLLAQATNFFPFNIDTMLLEYMFTNCRDSLELIRSKLENRPGNFRRSLFERIDKFIKSKENRLNRADSLAIDDE